ncbi:hypothetical protein NAV33_07185 [Pseudomonas stutzeri]|uniref:hypothetical protein n=1 Tax=Stutzerimonas stutzeri TaxID=316 RepID=UPI00210E6ECF|nr:hypothetical protein [Stutzerimonas stutzeri]MCQ4311677.1 hypothetical protein [Stutzerimonas stutzeri]
MSETKPRQPYPTREIRLYDVEVTVEGMGTEHMEFLAPGARAAERNAREAMRADGYLGRGLKISYKTTVKDEPTETA